MKLCLSRKYFFQKNVVTVTRKVKEFFRFQTTAINDEHPTSSYPNNQSDPSHHLQHLHKKNVGADAQEREKWHGWNLQPKTKEYFESNYTRKPLCGRKSVFLNLSGKPALFRCRTTVNTKTFKRYDFTVIFKNWDFTFCLQLHETYNKYFFFEKLG